MPIQEPLMSNCGLAMPPILYGTAWKKERTAPLVEQAIGLGFRGIDTACQPKHYDEAGVGIGVAAALGRGLSREELYLQTKFTSLDGQDPARVPYDPGASLPEQVAQSCQRSLRNLQTDYLDCLVLHSPPANPRQLPEVWRAMEAEIQSGRCRQLGVSNCYHLAQLESLFNMARVKPAVLQNRFYADTGYDRQLRAYCLRQGIIYQSFWTLTANPRVLAHGVVRGLAERYRRTPAQVFFRFLTQEGIVPLTGTTSAQHMADDLAIFDFELSREECAQVDALLG